MNKCILMNQSVILREVLRQVDRVNNRIILNFNIEPYYGVSYTQQIQGLITQAQIVVTQQDEPALWVLMKDTSQQEMVQLVYDYLTEHYFDVAAHWNYLKAPQYISSASEIPGGDDVETMVPSGYEAAYKAVQDDKFQGPNLFIFELLYERGIDSIVLQEVADV